MDKKIGNTWFNKIASDIKSVLETQQNLLEQELIDLEARKESDTEIKLDEYDYLHQAKMRCKHSILMALNADDANTLRP